MEQLSRIKAQRVNLQDLLGLFRALRGMAASHVQEAQKALKGIRHYIVTIEGAIGEGASLLPASDAAAWAQENPEGSDWLVAVCTEHGFTGGLNDRLLDHALDQILPGQKLGIIGRRGAMVLEERARPADWVVPMSTHVGGVVGLARQVAELIGDSCKAEIVYPVYARGGEIAIEHRPILPLAPDLLSDIGRAPPLHHLAPLTLLAELAEEYLFAEITRALMEAVASENAARLQVMQGADFNTKDKLTKLMRQERRLRQEEITAELLELATGVNAILHTEHQSG